MCGSGRESCFQLLVGNASGKPDLLHTAQSPLRVVLFLSRCFLQDPIFIEFSEMLFALFCSCVWWKTAFSRCLVRFEAGVRLHAWG